MAHQLTSLYLISMCMVPGLGAGGAHEAGYPPSEAEEGETGVAQGAE
jgi:hypothetical protein